MSTIEKTPVILKDKTEDVYGFEVLKAAEYADGSGFGKGAWDARKGIPALVGKATAEVPNYKKGQAMADLAVQTIAGSIVGIRRMILLPNGSPDWAGNTYAYAAVFEAHFLKALKDAGLTGKEEVRRFRGAIRESMSSNQATLNAVTAFVVEADPALASKEVEVKGQKITLKALADAAVKRDPLADGVALKDLPKEVQEGVQTQYANQVTKTGKALNGFAAVPPKFGKKERTSGTGTVEEKDGAKVDQASAVLAGTRLSPLERTLALTYAVTAYADGVIGKPSDHESGVEPDLGPDRDTILALLADVQNYLGLIAEYKGATEENPTSITRKDLYGMRKVRPNPNES